jgi:hypothetical protein
VKLRSVGAGAGGCLLSWAVGATRTAAVVGGTLTWTAADVGRSAGRAPAATARRSTGVRAGVRLDAVRVTGCACSRCELAVTVQTPARTSRTSNRDAAGGGPRPGPRGLHAVGPQAGLVAVAAPCGRWCAWRVRSAPGTLPISSQHHESGQSEYLASIPVPRKKVRQSATESPLRGSRGPPGAAAVSGASLSTRSACGAVVNTISRDWAAPRRPGPTGILSSRRVTPRRLSTRSTKRAGRALEPATCCLGDNCQSSAQTGPVGSRQLRLGGVSVQCGLVGCSMAWWNDHQNDHLSKQ